MKKLLHPFLLPLAAIALLGCSVYKPGWLRPNWKWDGVPRVMPNSSFAPVADAQAARAEIVSPLPLPASSLREEISLDGPWRYQPDPQPAGEAEQWFSPEYDDQAWKTMAVPNNFSIADVSLKNFYQPVWFRRSFDLPASFTGKQLRLQFEGVDYFAKVWLNGRLLGEHEGYFNPFFFDVTGLVQPGKNVVVVKVTNPWDMAMQSAEEALNVRMAEKIWVKSVLNYHNSRPGTDTDRAKDSQSFGTGGICLPVKLTATGQAAINWVLVTPKLLDHYTRAEAAFEIFVSNFAATPQEALIQVQAVGENFNGNADVIAAKVVLAPGPNKVQVVLPVAHPRLWWPWSHPELGGPALYRAEIAVAIAGQVTDQFRQTFGLKEVKLTEEGPEAFFWNVNGKRLFFRGTNGIPSEYLSRLTPEYLSEYFRKLKDHNMDLLIVHDFQAPPFIYDWADREGIVVLQNHTLIWEVNVCDFVRPNGDPQLTNNAAVIGRMTAEAIWLLYNHPSIFWWSMHDEPNYIGFGGHAIMHRNVCRAEPFGPDEKMPVFQDLSLNQDLDREVTRIARALNPTIPIHRTGGLETDTVTWYGWYKGLYFGLIRDPEAMPLEFGAEAVSYALAGAMNYFPEWWPIRSERAANEWKYHGLQLQPLTTHTGRTEAYANFNDWAFATQLYQAALIKYHIEINRENKYHPAASVVQFMYNDWWPAATKGVTDWNLIDKLALDWMRTAYSPQLVATRVSRNLYSQGERIQIPIHLLNDQYLDFPKARVSWKLIEETDSFVIMGQGRAGHLSWDNLIAPVSVLRTMRQVPVMVTIGHQIPKAIMLTGKTEVDLPADSHQIAATVSFDAPRTAEPRHYTLYLTLTAADGRVLCENWDHFLVAPNAKKFRPVEGISPEPRFDLEMSLTKDGRPLAEKTVTVMDKYDSTRAAEVALDRDGHAHLTGLKPGAYRLQVEAESYEFLLNRDEKLSVDFRPGLKTTLGVKPIIEWKEGMGQP